MAREEKSVEFEDIVRAICLSDDGRVLAVFCRNSVALVNTEDGVVLRHIQHPDWHQPFMLFGQDASLLLLGQTGTYDEPGILEMWRVDDGSLLYSSTDSEESTTPWTHLASAALASDGSIMLSCYGELVPNSLQKEFGGGVLWGDGKGLCAVYVWQAKWSHLLEEAQRQSKRRGEVAIAN